jgi:hypothetical protein
MWHDWVQESEGCGGHQPLLEGKNALATMGAFMQSKGAIRYARSMGKGGGGESPRQRADTAAAGRVNCNAPGGPDQGGGSGPLAACGIDASGAPTTNSSVTGPLGAGATATEPAAAGYGALRWHYRHNMWPPFGKHECTEY